MLCDGRASDKLFPKLNIFKESNTFSFQSLGFDERIGVYRVIEEDGRDFKPL
jgi:hypothetical protein